MSLLRETTCKLRWIWGISFACIRAIIEKKKKRWLNTQNKIGKKNKKNDHTNLSWKSIQGFKIYGMSLLFVVPWIMCLLNNLMHINSKKSDPTNLSWKLIQGL